MEKDGAELVTLKGNIEHGGGEFVFQIPKYAFTLAAQEGQKTQKNTSTLLLVIKQIILACVFGTCFAAAMLVVFLAFFRFSARTSNGTNPIQATGIQNVSYSYNGMDIATRKIAEMARTRNLLINDVASLSSGVDLGRGYILACRHGILDSRVDGANPKINSKTTASFVSVSKAIEKWDLALLYSEEFKNSELIKVRTTPPSLKENVVIVGNPHGNVGKVMSAQISELNTMRNPDFFSVDGYAIGGNSGGGVYSENQELIGIVLMRNPDLGTAICVWPYPFLKNTEYVKNKSEN